MRVISPLSGQPQPSLRVDEEACALRDGGWLQEQSVVVVDGNKPPVKHPVNGCAQCQTVTHAVRTVVCHRTDVGRLRLRPAPTVENAQAADRAGVVVRPLDACGEHSIAEGPIGYLFYEWAVSKQLGFVRRFLPKDPKPLGVVCL